jgi:hypothetical protein
MTYVWYQQWVALPVIVEEHMGDTSRDGAFPLSGSFQQQYPTGDPQQGFPKLDSFPQVLQPMSGNAPFYSQYSALPNPQQRMDNSRYPYAAGGTTSQAGSSFNMTAVAGALPDYNSQTQAALNARPQSSGQPRPAGASTPAMVYQMQQNLQYPHQSALNYGSQSGHGGYGQGQFGTYGQSQGGQGGSFPQMQQQRMGGMPQQYPGYSPVSPQYYYFPGASSGYPPMSFAPGASLQSPMLNRGISGMPGLGAESQDAFMGADGVYPGEY